RGGLGPPCWGGATGPATPLASELFLVSGVTPGPRAPSTPGGGQNPGRVPPAPPESENTLDPVGEPDVGAGSVRALRRAHPRGGPLRRAGGDRAGSGYGRHTRTPMGPLAGHEARGGRRGAVCRVEWSALPLPPADPRHALDLPQLPVGRPRPGRQRDHDRRGSF